VGDPGRLRQVLLNLIENAVKFTDEGEVIVHVASKKHTDAQADVSFSVEDTGIGIPKENQESVFNAFKQVDAGITRRYGGTGLGLAVSSQLVRLMGGELTVTSEPGRGSRFAFTATFNRRPGKAHLTEPVDADLQGVHILVVDDNASTRRFTKEMLDAWQPKVQFASNAEEARLILTASQKTDNPIDLVLIDSDMPGSDGFSLARWINDQKFNNLRVIMMLVFPHLKRKAEFPGLGVKTGVIKPLNPAELLDAIQICLDKKRADTRQPAKEKAAMPRTASRAAKILVAEDTPFNQTFILRLLEKNGFKPILVENGRQAVEAYHPDEIDIILMDVQMPEMDGFEATREIRKREAQNGGHIPIIAMTAYATEGDRERCLEAGMDDYVSKPISAAKLFQAIDALVSPEASDSSGDGAGSSTVESDGLIKSFENDHHLFQELVEIFVNDYPQMLATLRTSLKNIDGKTLSRTAHSLKGMLRNFRAEAVAGKAFELEKIGQQGDLDGADQLVENLAARLDEVAKRLKQLVSELSGR
jgi:two-component system, sensor histidine kinase and response regulator